jgi:dihydrofolate reductase
MRKIILDVAVTLDGFIEGPNGEIDWLASEEATDFGNILFGILDGVDAVFYGRVSYEKWGNYAPPKNANPKLKAAYDLLHSKQKYVFSNSKSGDSSRAIFINSDIEEKVSEIKRQPGENIWLYGGGKLITTFVNSGLIDVYRLAVYPVILGSGKPLFSGIREGVKLRLLEAEPFGSGVTLLSYESPTNQ